MIMLTFIKKKTFNWVCLQFRGLVHYHHEGHGGVQADMVLEKELREFYILIHRQQELTVTIGLA